MSPLRWTLVALLIASTALFVVGVIAERSTTDTHTEPAGVRVGETREPAGEPGGAHEEGEGSSAGEAGHAETPAGDSDTNTSEAVLGVNIESTPLIVLAALVGLGLAALTATRFGRRPGVLLAVAVTALAWAALDVREVVHQLDESRTGIAGIAIVVAVLHLAVALLAGVMAMRARQLDGGSPARPGTLPA
ncbi:hypothetical protein [Solirubrobacter soli]|uniref:hypothetical protein n=1 Tax=Solirubrobacter soli TaxID=363832 RepID=UPI0004077743|nr:hypothetical protein [Solirubrobacter soli]